MNKYELEPHEKEEKLVDLIFHNLQMLLMIYFSNDITSLTINYDEHELNLNKPQKCTN